MLPSRPPITFAVGFAFLAFVLVTASTVRADTITYNVVDYPAAEIDVENGNQDQISGTVTASATGSLGSYVAGSFSSTDPSLVDLTYNLTLQNIGTGGGTVSIDGSGPLSNFLGSGTVEFTPTSMLLDNGYISLQQSGPGTSAGIEWRSDESFYQGLYSNSSYSIYGPEYQFSDSTANNQLGPSPWLIGTAAPEPGTLPLLAAMLGSGGIFLVYRRFKRSCEPR